MRQCFQNRRTLYSKYYLCKGQIFQNIVLRTNIFKKRRTLFLKLHRPISALYSTVHVQCMYSACTVHLQCMYGACTVHLFYLYSACMVHVQCIFRMLYGVNRLLCRDTEGSSVQISNSTHIHPKSESP